MPNNPTGPRLKAARVLPLLVTTGLMLFCWLNLRDVTFREVVSYTPKNLWLAALALLAIYTVKSMSVVFPLTALYLASGVIFPLWAALLVNLLGLALCATLPYLAGRFTGRGLVAEISKRYPKLGRAVALGGSNEVFLSYLLRAVGVIPGDVASAFLGAAGIGYGRYLAGSLLGYLPAMLVQTLMGANMDDPLAPSFLGLFVLTILLSLAAGWLYNKRARARDCR